MKDAFGNEIIVCSKVLYSIKRGSSTDYHLCHVVKLYPAKKEKGSYSPPDRVALKVAESSRGTKYSKDPIVYASNVVRLPVTFNGIWVPTEPEE